ncbi:CHAT domain-containing tetratricopeptide repeat protein [Anabaena sp. UHCC 0204]|uniref:CHAT domain-containing protein n=1 Tax=Anabaena sp. UHCC 0204 TaxID=2590009 RepID=UPI0020C45663|nr:CHAT domain-containing tetratricopeptide repeat protein [Anabaena sp. UHCC 0204]
MKKPTSAPVEVKPARRLTDAEYEALFFRLLAKVEQGLTRGGVKGLLAVNGVTEAELIIWLRGFGERLLVADAPNQELGRRLVQLRDLGMDLGEVAYQIGVQLQPEETNDVVIPSASEEITEVGEAETWLNRGNEQLMTGDFEAALASYDQVLQFKPDDHQAWDNRGAALGNLGRNEEAIASFDKALYFQPDFYQTWYNQGIALRDLGRYEEAIASFEKALDIQPEYHHAWHNRGAALSDLGRYEEAIVSFDKALYFQHDDHYTWNGRGIALRNLGRYEEAIASFDKALYFQIDYHYAWYNQGIALRDLGRYEEAIISFDQSVQFKSDYYHAWSERGVVLGNLERYEEAIASFDKALNLQPDYHYAWHNRGAALSNLERDEEAIASYDQALQFKPDYHQTWHNRGIAAGQSRNCDPYLSLLSAVARRNPDLNQRGYDGKLASYEEGLKYCPQPEAQGLLHQAIGNAHYFQGLSQRHPRTYYRKAVKSYNESLKFLTVADFPQLRLEVLRDLIRVHLHLGKTTEAQELKRLGTDLLRRLLDESQNPTQKKQLTLKFVSFQQFTVDLAVQSGNWCAALELAEEGKNACLGWLLPNLPEDSTSKPHQPKLAQIQQLLNPTTAIVYWHLSPYALHTFILTENKPPVILQTSSQHLQQFETWTKTWNEEYSKHRKGKDSLPEAQPTWRDHLPSKLQQLREILDIAAIVNIINDQESNSIQNLILIPHRDLHLFPLHATFPDNFTITYLPSAQIGINLKKFNPNPTPIHQLPILSIENPNHEGYGSLPYAEIESAAINQLFPISQQLAQNQATNQEVINALQNNYGILHFTGHGFYNFNNPQKSALALSGKDLLTLEEIYNIPNLNKYQLVTLSACETAITNQQTITAEYVGLVSAFLAQGVNTVISTLWTVPDNSSGFFMIYFYWQLKKGKPPALALKKSQKWLSNLTFAKLERIYKLIFPKLPREEVPLRPFIRPYIAAIPSMSIAEKQQKLYANPYYWAGFTITGC